MSDGLGVRIELLEAQTVLSRAGSARGVGGVSACPSPHQRALCVADVGRPHGGHGQRADPHLLCPRREAAA